MQEVKIFNLSDSVSFYAIACQLAGQCRSKQQGLGVLFIKSSVQIVTSSKAVILLMAKLCLALEKLHKGSAALCNLHMI